MSNPTKAEIIEALRAFIGQSPNLDRADYGSDQDYRQDSRQIARQIARQLKAAKELLGIIERASYLDASHLLGAMDGGRLSYEGGKIHYIVGQYWPTEYRAAVAALCAKIIWYSVREDMPIGSNAGDIKAQISLNWKPSSAAMAYFH